MTPADYLRANDTAIQLLTKQLRLASVKQRIAETRALLAAGAL